MNSMFLFSKDLESRHKHFVRATEIEREFVWIQDYGCPENTVLLVK
jgi:hypothetical protein